MALHIIEKLRQKPKFVRDNIALAVAGSVTSLVLAAWFVTSTDQLSEVVQSSKQGASAFSTFIGHAKNEVSSVVDSLPDKEAFVEAASSTQQAQVEEPVSARVVIPVEADSRVEVRIATTAATTTSTTSDSI